MRCVQQAGLLCPAVLFLAGTVGVPSVYLYISLTPTVLFRAVST